MAAESEVEESINQRIQSLQRELEGKIEDEFNQILKSLDEHRRDGFRQNFSGGRNHYKGIRHGNSDRGEDQKKSFQSNKSNGRNRNGQFRRNYYSKGQIQIQGPHF